MRLLCITDLHGRLAMLSRILTSASPVDAVLLGGDLTNFGSPIDVEKVVRLAEESSAPVLTVAGNCDSAEIDRRLVEMGVSVSGRGTVLGSIAIQGVSGMPPWKGGMYSFTEEDLGRLLADGCQQIRDHRRVVLAHVPPRDTRLDRTIFGRHVGSSALRGFIERTQPALVVCGHIHEARGIDQIGETTVVNCGHAAIGEYAVADVGEEVAVGLHVAYR
jgi:uncharacterized protein